MGIGPTSGAWKALILPLNYTCIFLHVINYITWRLFYATILNIFVKPFLKCYIEIF